MKIMLACLLFALGCSSPGPCHHVILELTFPPALKQSLANATSLSVRVGNNPAAPIVLHEPLTSGARIDVELGTNYAVGTPIDLEVRAYNDEEPDAGANPLVSLAGGTAHFTLTAKCATATLPLASGFHSLELVAGKPNTPAFADGVGGEARFSGPRGISYDGSGTLYVADGGNRAIRKIALANGTVSTVYPAAVSSDGGVNGFDPYSVYVVGGTLYIANAAVVANANTGAPGIGGFETLPVESAGSMPVLLFGLSAPEFIARSGMTFYYTNGDTNPDGDVLVAPPRTQVGIGSAPARGVTVVGDQVWFGVAPNGDNATSSELASFAVDAPKTTKTYPTFDFIQQLDTDGTLVYVADTNAVYSFDPATGQKTKLVGQPTGPAALALGDSTTASIDVAYGIAYTPDYGIIISDNAAHVIVAYVP